jgi:hypothetical protein
MASSRLQKPIPSISRDHSPIAVLADRKAIDVGDRDIRVDDYLNDKLQTETDFADLDSLIANVETQRIQLQEQVSDYVPSATGLCGAIANLNWRSIKCQG